MKFVVMKRYRKNQKTFKSDFFTKFKIVVPTVKDRTEIMEAFRYLHNCDIDTGFVTVNQLTHEYEHHDESDKYSNIIVDSKLYANLARAK